MTRFEPIWALGLMSGTSMDGVDGAMVLTDGVEIIEFGGSAFRPYTDSETAALKAAQGLWPQDDPNLLSEASHVVQSAHRDVIGEFDNVDLVGFHGQTLAHDPAQRRTHQLGDGAALATQSGCRVVWDFRSADMTKGGEGAPLAPFFHFACAKHIGAREPLAFLNLGGVGNVTWVDPAADRPESPNALLAFDTGPANAPINDLVFQRRGLPFDEDGKLAQQGTVHEDIITRLYQRQYFGTRPPKSLDRNDFVDALDLVSELSDEDALATLTALSAACVALAADWLPATPSQWMVSGGGLCNPVVMEALKTRLNQPVLSIEDAGFDGDMLEAQAFAYLAVRVQRGLPTSAPGTTGCSEPVCGGKISTPG